jgi:hypothetical protein
LTVTTRSNWIIGEREDLVWFIGPAVAAYAALALLASGFPLMPIYFLWLIGIDGPHVVATVTRTYCDPQERHRLGSLVWVVAPAIAVGPLMVVTHADTLFYMFAVSWLHFHISKQHVGFVMLYRHKARERDDAKLDRYFLLTSLMLPFARFLVKTNFVYLPNLPPVRALDRILLITYVAFAAFYVIRQVYRWKSRAPMNAPKLLLLAAIVPLQWLAFGYAASFSDGITRAGIILGLFHSLQYHRLMWFHNRNRYGGGDWGIASVLARRFVYYAGAAIGLNLLLNVLPAQFAPSPFVKAALWGIPFTHYILDSRIWRVRGNPQLAAALRLS